MVCLATIEDPRGETGFISFGRTPDKDGRGNAEIHAIYVLSQFWHQGVRGDLVNCVGHFHRHAARLSRSGNRKRRTQAALLRCYQNWMTLGNRRCDTRLGFFTSL